MMQAFAITISAILWWAVLSVASRILLLRFGFDPWMFSFLQLCAGGVALLMVGGREGFDLTSFRRSSTWILGALRVLSAALYTAVLALVSVLEAGILGALNLPVIALAVWLLSRRRPLRFEWGGYLLVLGAIGFLAGGLEPEVRMTALGLMLFNAVCLAAVTLLAERHPDNLSDLPGARARFTGAVLLVTAAAFLAGRLIYPGGFDVEIDLPLVVASFLVGVLLRAPAMLLAFWSIRLVGAQAYTAAISLLPLFGMILEQIAVTAGWLEESRLRSETLYLAAAVLAGTLILLMARRRNAGKGRTGSGP